MHKNDKAAKIWVNIVIIPRVTITDFRKENAGFSFINSNRYELKREQTQKFLTYFLRFLNKETILTH